ncbi:MAG: response regulator transcription factor [Pseudoflavonifractor sp.]|nr:response regulator transcription factor [Pseudoflavonifractor sp.]
MRHHNIALLLPSPLIASGIRNYLRRLSGDIVVSDLPCGDLVNAIRDVHPAVLIADPVMLGADDVEAIRAETRDRIKIVALYSSALPAVVVRRFDETLSIYDSDDVISSVLQRCVTTSEGDDDATPVLSQREKEVVVRIVKGMSNKEIATEMNVSVNTVMTHRRNIASKLQIHSPAGLTIYAIVSKLVRLDEIKTTLPR